MEMSNFSSTCPLEEVMAIVTVGIDLATVIVHYFDATDKPILLLPSMPRAKLTKLNASLPPYLIGMKPCSGSRHWERLFASFGHTVRLMASKFVTLHRLSDSQLELPPSPSAASKEYIDKYNNLP